MGMWQLAFIQELIEEGTLKKLSISDKPNESLNIEYSEYSMNKDSLRLMVTKGVRLQILELDGILLDNVQTYNNTSMVKVSMKPQNNVSKVNTYMFSS